MPELILLFLSYFNAVSFPTDNYYKEDISHFYNQVGNLLVSECYINGQYLYSREIIIFEEWNAKMLSEQFTTSLKRLVREEMSRKGRYGSGIIPDIDLSLKMPKALSYIIGEGGHIAVDGSQSISVDVSRSQSPSLVGETFSSAPQIKLEQRLLANIHGTVGEKIHVQINHDSEAREQDNKLKIWYEGNEDDIVQRIDAGDLKALGGGRNQSVFGISTSGMIGSTYFDFIGGKLESNTISKSESYSFSKDSTDLFEVSYVKDRYYYTGLSELDSLISIAVFIEENMSIEHRTAILVDINGDSLGKTAEFVELIYGEDYELRYIHLPNNINFPFLKIQKYHSDEKLGIWYVYRNQMGEIDTLGYLPAPGDTLDTLLVLGQLRSQSPDPSETCWDLAMRNIYSFGTESPTSVDVTIYKVVSGGDDREIEPVSKKEYVELLGIDADGDGSTDPSQVMWQDGCIFFPYSKPFLESVLGTDTVSCIYNKKTLLSDEGKNFRIVITATSSKGAFVIGYGDLVDSSEVIVVDNVRTLTRGTDYRIDYETGRIVFTESANLNPESKISYTYDTEPLFSFTSRYIARTNIRAHPFANSDLNLQFAFRSSSNPEPHPRVGREPSHIAVGRIEFSTNQEPSILNRIFRSLPFVDNKSTSKIRMNGSYGFSLPNPATNGKSYLDDMESVKLARELELSTGGWNYCSQPDSSINIEDMGMIDWFSSRILKTYIYPDIPKEKQSQYIGTMVLYFYPNESLANKYNSWAGIMKAFSSEENFSQKKYLEVWVKGEEGDIFVELGSRMKEDIPRWVRASDGSDSLLLPNNYIDTEDRNDNFELEPGEDTGLDGIAFDDDKWSYITDSLDDGRDDYPDQLKGLQDSLKLHRKEGNRRLDSEDLNKDHSLEANSDYFRWHIDLESSELVANYGEGGWKMYRIPLTDSSHFEVIGSPSLESVLYARVWITGVEDTVIVSIAQIAIVGNKWRDEGVRSVSGDTLLPLKTRFLITYKNSYEDKDYVSPVEQEREIYGGYSKEQSLVFKIDSLTPDYLCLAESYLELPKEGSGTGYDLRLYSSLRFFAQMTDSPSDSIMVFLRLLTDTTNYYQYSTYLFPDKWDTLDVNFQDFYDLKLQDDTLNGKYSLKGHPTLTSIAYLQLGVVNQNLTDFTGEVYFDDIILLGANTEMGSDLNLSISSNVGDFISDISYNLTRQSARYKNDLNALRRIGDKDRIRHALRVVSNTGKIFKGFVSMPVTFDFTRNIEIPEYKKNSDILLPEDAKQKETGMSETRIIQFNLSRPSSSNNWLLKYSLDKIRVSGTYSLNQSYFPEHSADTSTNRTASFSYNLPLPSITPPVLSGGSSSLIPSNVSFSAGYKYNISSKYTYSSGDSLFHKTTVKPIREITPRGGLRYKPIRWIDLSYNISARNDLIDSDRFGETVFLSEAITASHNSSQFGINDINLSFSNTFADNHGKDYAKTLGDTLDVRSVSQSRTISVTDNFRIQNLLKNLPLLSRFSNNINSLRFTSSFSRSASFAYLSAIPDYRFRYGIDPKPNDIFIVQSNPSDGGTKSTQYSLATGLNLGRVTVDMSGSWRETRPDEEKLSHSVSGNKTISFSFPNANIYITNIDDYIPLLQKIVTSSKLNVSINKDSSTTVSLVGQEYSAGSATLIVSPGLDLKFTNGLGIKLSTRYTTTDQYSGSTYRIHSHNDSRDIKVTGTYSLQPSLSNIPIPFLRGIELKSPINLKASFGIQENKEISLNLSTQNEEIKRDNRNMTFDLSGDYNFSNMVTGGLTINYRNYLNRKIDNDVTTSYGMRFHIVFKF